MWYGGGEDLPQAGALTSTIIIIIIIICLVLPATGINSWPGARLP